LAFDRLTPSPAAPAPEVTLPTAQLADPDAAPKPDLGKGHTDVGNLRPKKA